MELLKHFYEDEHTREAFKAFQIQVLHEMAVDKVFDKKAIAGMYEAKKVVERSFEKLEETFAPEKKQIPVDPR